MRSSSSGAGEFTKLLPKKNKFEANSTKHADTVRNAEVDVNSLRDGSV